MFSKFDVKLVGGIMLITGTSIGGGMLALPISNSPAGFVYSTVFLFVCWLVMTLGALLILEVNLWLPSGSNMVTMAQSTLGIAGKAIAWLTYLFLFYSLLSAYISGGTDVLQNLIALLGIDLSEPIAAIAVVFILGWVVYNGIRAVDYANRGLMSIKMLNYAILVFLITPYVKMPNLSGGKLHLILGSLMVLVTSYGYACIVPSLRTYFDDDAVKLRKVIIVGSFIPLIVYTAWDLVIMGVIPRSGSELSLMSILASNHEITGLTKALENVVNSVWITDLFRFFSSICMLTAFLGVGISLIDFLADGLNLKKQGKQGLILWCATFIPPLLVVLIMHNAFIKALAYSGIFCVILLLLLPVFMAWSGRYHKKIAHGYQVIGGKASLIIGFLCGAILLINGIVNLL